MALLEAQFLNSNLTPVDGTWHALPTPSRENYQYQNIHLEDSYIDADGGLHRNIKRRNRAKIFCGWDLVKAEEMSLLETLYDQTFFIALYKQSQ